MEIHIGDRIADITLVGKEGNKVQLTIDGKPYEVDIVMAENGSCSILHNGNSFNAGLVRGEGGKSYDISMLQRSFHVEERSRREAGRQDSGTDAGQGSEHPRQGGRPTGCRRHCRGAGSHEDAE